MPSTIQYTDSDDPTTDDETPLTDNQTQTLHATHPRILQSKYQLRINSPTIPIRNNPPRRLLTIINRQIPRVTARVIARRIGSGNRVIAFLENGIP